MQFGDGLGSIFPAFDVATKFELDRFIKNAFELIPVH
jgi:hypothetical protein